MKKTLLLTLTPLAMALTANAQQEPARPKIIGVSHACYYTTDMARTAAFFTDYLGFEKAEGGLSIPTCTIIKFNDRQFIELFPDPEGTRNQSMHYCLETDDTEGWRKYLLALGYGVPAEPLSPGRTGNLNFFVPMPGGIACEFIQYLPTGMIAGAYGKFLPDTRVSDRLGHVGFMVDDMDKVMPFYTQAFGMKETWRGGSNPDIVQWVHMQLPDSEQTVEFMLYDREPSQGSRGGDEPHLPAGERRGGGPADTLHPHAARRVPQRRHTDRGGQQTPVEPLHPRGHPGGAGRGSFRERRRRSLFDRTAAEIRKGIVRRRRTGILQ